MTAVSAGLVVRPGDVLVVGLRDDISAAAADELRARLLKRLPGLGGIAFITQVTALATYRTENADATQD
ncbi:MAG TPA: hypothetical protein VF657_22010 [Actinoplanes sp.]